MDSYGVTAQQDALRPLRMFVGALTGAMLGADQSSAGADAWSFSPPGGYQSVGPYSYSEVGKPISATPGGGLYISPVIVMIALGAAAVLLVKG